MSTQTVFLASGSTSNTVDVAFIQSSTGANPGDPFTTLAFNSAGLTCYQRVGAATTPTAVTLATQTVGGAFSAGGLVLLDATHMPGSCRFDIPNSLIPVSGEANFVFTGVSGLATHTLKVIVVQNFYLGQMAQSYAAVGTAPNLAQCLYDIRQFLYELGVVGTTGTVKKLDHSTAAHTVTFNDPASPTSRTQTT